jgi:hypothetical protein
VAWRGDELDSESAEIEDDVAERRELRFAAAAASGRYLTELQ